MAKTTKKSTLSDLNAFLKNKQETEAAAPEQDAPESAVEETTEAKAGEFLKAEPKSLIKMGVEYDGEDDEAKKIAQEIKLVADQRNENIRKVFFKVARYVLEEQDDVNPTDVHLLNSIYYMQYQDEMNDNLANLLGG